MAKLLVYGSLNIDYVYQMPHFVQPGETLLSLSRQEFAGGKGLNQAVALAKAGGNVYFEGAVGKNDGALLLQVLKDNHIDLTFVKERDNMASGHTVIQVDPHGQNCILLYGGANHSHSKEEIDTCLSTFASGDYLVLQNETNDVAYIMAQAAAKGLKVCVNASPLNQAIFEMPLEKCEFIIVNEIEGSALVEEKEDADPYLILSKLKAKYPQSSFVLTLGSKGSLLSMAQQDAVIACKAYKVQAVDTTAAGDTFLGYFVEQISSNVEPQIALQRATAASAIAVTRKGAVPSIPAIEEVLAFVKEHGSTLVDKL